MTNAVERNQELRQVEGGLFEVLWRPGVAGAPTADHRGFADHFPKTDTGKWLTARGDDYILLTEPSGRAAYLLVQDPAVIRLLLIKLGGARPI